LFVFALGFGIAFWRASGEIDVHRQATRLAEMALAAQDQAKALSEELINERQARKLALTAQEAAETVERSVRDQLVLESEARETAERAHDKAADRAADAAQRLAEQAITTKKLETRLADSVKQLELANAKTAAQIAARKDVQVELYNAKAQLRTLSAQLPQEIGGKEAPEAAQAQVETDAKANAEKLALEVKRREAASNTKRAPLNRRVAFRRQRQAAARQLYLRTRY
jgi:hypothetical protein